MGKTISTSCHNIPKLNKVNKIVHRITTNTINK